MNNQSDNIRDKIIGLGESSIRKSYYPELKKKLDEIQELNKSLEMKVEERTKELNQKNSALEKTLHELNTTQQSLIEAEKMAALGTLVAGVAHEINTPIGINLTAISHFQTILENIQTLYKNENLSQEELENFFATSKSLADSISIQTKKTAGLIKSFKRISIDHYSDEVINFNIYEYISEVIYTLKIKTNKYNQKIKLDIPKDLMVHSASSVFSQIFINLITNSIVHGFDNTKSGNIEIKIRQEETTLYINYKDDGKGISSENLEKIYDPFFTTDRSSGGTGLGLNIVYNIITSKLGGTITCKSSESQGTEFIITIPNC